MEHSVYPLRSVVICCGN